MRKAVSSPTNRVVVTGLGAVTPIGLGAEGFWAGLASGCNGVGEVTRFDASDFRSKLAAEVKDFHPEEWLDRRAAARMDRFVQFAMVAAQMAYENAGLGSFDFDPTRAGVIIGSGIGGSKGIEDGYSALGKRGPRGMSPFTVSLFLINMAACQVSIEYGLKGYLSAPSVACSTGAEAIGQAMRVLQRGDADLMFAGASEACIDVLAYGGFCATRSMTINPDPETASRPFDRNRNGFVMGEGAGIVVLEALDHARVRGAQIHAELIGYGNTADAHHLTAPHPEGDGMIRVMQAALDDAGIEPEQVDYINAHGTSTLLNDKCESAAVLEVFGEHARSMKMSSNKSMIGHLMAASGAVEFVATVMSIKKQMAPPTIHYRDPDPQCPLDYVANEAMALDLEVALKNSFGFGGGNASLAVRKMKG
ncbi:MAG: beta-ketoacyl-ACP synthase II [bacterium]|nr:beta-ketoacyl-ACP synthase II [bacterium]